jgi:hypothetical protein
MEKAKGQCAHPNCSCSAASGSKYCSPYCESAKNRDEISCDCGHRGCKGNVAKAS